MRKMLITGGARGIGKAITELFALNGYDVVAPTRKELDLSEEDSVKAFIEKNNHTYFDVIINNAAINELNEIENITDQEIRQMMQINLISPILLIQGFIAAMKKRHYGRIVNIGSIWSVVSKSGRCLYSATKNGIHGVTNTLAVELAKDNILVNTVCPGFTLTEMTRKNNPISVYEEIVKEIPLGRMAEPIEIAKVVFFLAHETNSYLTGQKITVDGGFTIR